MKQLELIKYLKTHSLEDLKNEFFIRVKKHYKYPELISLTYNQIDSPLTEKIVQECRGMIINKDTLEVVSMGYSKFFNLFEPNAGELDWETVHVEDKLDGTCIFLWNYKGEWCINTTGTPDAKAEVYDYNIFFDELFWEVFNEKGYSLDLDKNKTYSFELLTPLNQVVVYHDKRDLILHGVRDLNTLEEENPQDYDYLFKVVNTYPFTDIDTLLQLSESLNGREKEGFVLVDKDFNRLKLKCPEYVELHSHIDKLSKKRMIHIVFYENEVCEVLVYFPFLQSIFKDIQKVKRELVEEIKETFKQYKDIENQIEFAQAIKGYDCSGILFRLRAGSIHSVEEGLAELTYPKLKKLLINRGFTT